MIAPAAGATWDALHTDAAGNLNATAALIFLLRTNVSCFDVDMFLSSDGVVFIGHPVKEAARLSVQPAEVGLRCMLCVFMTPSTADPLSRSRVNRNRHRHYHLRACCQHLAFNLSIKALPYWVLRGCRQGEYCTSQRRAYHGPSTRAYHDPSTRAYALVVLHEIF